MARSRNRVSDAPNGGLSGEEVQDAVTVSAPLRLSVSIWALKEQVNDAIIQYSVAFELASSSVAARDRQRGRLKKAVENLLEIAQAGETQALVELLRFYPATMQMLDGPIRERIGSLRLAALIQNLQEFSDALENRVFDDDLNFPDNDASPAFPALVGALWDAFDASFLDAGGERKETRFDAFARKVLQAAGVRPVNGAPFANTAIKDALRTHRKFVGQS